MMNKIDTNNFIKSVIDSLIIITGIVYILGFITVNSYLMSFGIIQFEFIKTKYISAGILLLFILAAYTSFAMPQILVKVKTKLLLLNKINNTINSIVWISAFLLFLILFFPEQELKFVEHQNQTVFLISLLIPIIFVITSIIGNILEEKDQQKYRKHNIILKSLSDILFICWILFNFQNQVKYLILWGLAFGGLLWFMFSPEIGDENSKSNILSKSPCLQIFRSNWPKLGLGIPILILLTLYFGKFLYPLINPAVGGGKPFSAIIIPKEEKKTELEKMINHNKVIILDQTNNYLYVQTQEVKNSKTIQISKDIISGIIFQKSKVGIDE